MGVVRVVWRGNGVWCGWESRESQQVREREREWEREGGR